MAGAARASASTMTKTSGAVTKDEVMASDNAEVSGRANVQESIRDLAESTGGFLIGDSNDLRVPLRHVNEEISSYYEVSFNPGIQNYDGSFRKIAVNCQPQGSGDPRAQRLFRAAAGSPRRRAASHSKCRC